MEFFCHLENCYTASTNQEPSLSGDRARPHKFTFDYAHWSHDRSDEHFATQEKVFNDLGMDVVGNAFNGYNVCVFAYGQTGSGKTYTMMGIDNSQSSPVTPPAPGTTAGLQPDKVSILDY